jgi:hypothetical protein
MEIRIQPNAAALSSLALAESLRSRAEMDKNLFNLVGNSTKMSVNLAKSQANNALEGMTAQANQTELDGIGGIGGSLAAVGMTGVSTYMQSRNEDILKSKPDVTQSATFEEQPDETELTSLSENAPRDTEIPSRIDSPSNAPADQGQGAPERPHQRGVLNSQNPKPQTEEQLTPAQQQADRNANWWLQNGRNFSDMANQFIVGAFKLGTIDDIKKQGQAQAAQAFAKGIAEVMSTQTGVFTSAIQSCDSFMNNTNSVVAAIIASSKG